MYYLLYNPLSDNNNGEEAKKKLINLYSKRFPNIQPIIFVGLEFSEFVKTLTPLDTIILSGGDGTINVFANKIKQYPIPCKVLFYAGGTGNDFANDVNKEIDLIELDKYLECLPKVKINGSESYFINNVGYGLDGTVCEIADLKKTQGKKINYTTIAVGLLLKNYKPCNAKVTVDGVTKEYKNVWLAPTMNGRYYGGGMKMAPDQDRFSKELTCIIIHDAPRLKTSIAFLSIFKGNHLKKYPKLCDVYKGKHIKVEFDRPNAIQVDGEVTLGVLSYEAYYEE